MRYLEYVACRQSNVLYSQICRASSLATRHQVDPEMTRCSNAWCVESTERDAAYFTEM